MIPKNATVSGRYARALFILTEKLSAREGGALIDRLDRTLADLKGLDEVVRPGTRAGDFLAHPQVRPADKRTVLETALKGRALPSVAVFADLLLRKKRLNLAGEIAHEFQGLVERAKGLQRAQVVSATPLTPTETSRLHETLERVTGKKIVLAADVDPTLLGGAYVRIGDRVIDRSVKTLLEAISNQLYEASV